MIALDTETTGQDHYHGARPFLVTICNDANENTFWEWPVDPVSRMPVIPDKDKKTITAMLLDPDNEFVLHNSRFDCAALNTVLSLPQEIEGRPEWYYWPWDRTEDTLTAGHVLASALPHGLDKMAKQYLRYAHMNAFEDKVEVACRKARDYVRRHLPDWRIAKVGDPMMPSFRKTSSADKDDQDKDKGWKMDMWLLKALTSYKKHPVDQWEQIVQFRKQWAGEDGDGLCADYANLDTAVTHRLWPVVKAELKRRDLWNHYKDRMRLLPIAYRLERNGLTISETRLEEQTRQFTKGVSEATETCVRVAKGMSYPLTLPAGAGVNDNLRTFFFGEATVSCSECNKRIVAESREWARQQAQRSGVCNYCKKPSKAVVREWPWLDLPVVKRTDAGQPSMDKDVISEYLGGTELSEVQREFLTALKLVRGGAKALDALEGYRSFWLPIPGAKRLNPKTGEPEQLYRLLHPNLNPTGTDTLRWSCKNPNLQNISKKEDYNLRYPFGPAPGREGWSLDYRNIEKRIPGYECGEQTFIDLFEKADQPPFFGSDHILKFSAVYPHLWEKMLKEHGPMHAADMIKKPEAEGGYKATYYQWIKNTNFALQYECGDAKADATAHAKGVKKLLAGSFPLEAAMKRYWIAFANKHGYVETMPRRSVNPSKGYPLMTQRTNKFGRDQVSPTIPLAYHVSGTAMDLTAAAMIVCQRQLDVWNRECRIPNHYRMSLQVHDELFFDFPREADPKKNPRRSNLGRVRILQRLMEDCGKDIVCKRVATDGKIVELPTPVSVDYHPDNWSKGIAV